MKYKTSFWNLRVGWLQWWAKSNRDSIQSRFKSPRRFDSKSTRFDSAGTRFDSDSIQNYSIRFKKQKIWPQIPQIFMTKRSFSISRAFTTSLAKYCSPRDATQLRPWHIVIVVVPVMQFIYVNVHHIHITYVIVQSIFLPCHSRHDVSFFQSLVLASLLVRSFIRFE